METINQTETTNVSKKKNQKKILIIIPVAIIAVLVLAFIFGEKVPKVDEADAIAITADEISEKFLSDKTGTDKEFHNKVYEISGTVKNANSQYSVTFSTESGEYEIYCDMDSEKTNKVPDLEKGDKATIKGLYNRVGTDRIDFKDCLYVTSEKVTEPPTEPETEAKKADNNDSKADSSNEAAEASTEKTNDVPKEYQNALKKAEIYSDTMYMSKSGIYNQLTSEYGEGFSEDAADYAIENLDADYKANALAKAKTYQETMAMSKSAIYDQLVSEYGEGFTEEEAQYAIDNLED